MPDVHHQPAPISIVEQFKDEYRGFEITVFDTRYKLYNPTENYVMYAASIDEARKKIDKRYKSR